MLRVLPLAFELLVHSPKIFTATDHSAPRKIRCQCLMYKYDPTAHRRKMRYQIEFLPSAFEQLRALPKNARRLIGGKLDRAQRDLAGDIKKLKGFKNKYRLRAGNYRALFELEGACLVVYDVGDRKDIYE